MIPIMDHQQRSLEYLRISVTDRCNFRCSYCMPAHLFGQNYPFIPPDELLSFDEITRLAKVLIQLGVSKIRLTGGEPLVRKNIEHLITRLVAIDGIDEVTMTTNGLLLAKRA